MPGAGDPAADRLRAGGRALLLLADPVSVAILRELASGPLESPELLARIGHISRSTYFDRLRDLEELSIIARRRQADVPPVAKCRLAPSGDRLLFAAGLLEAWLNGSPQGPLEFGDAYATVATKALAVGWGSTLLRWMAERPRSLTELEQLVDGFGYRKLERATRDLVQAGLAERAVARGRLNPYEVTPWAREAVSPLVAAIRWERHEIPGRSASVTSVEAEGALLLALPLIDLPADVNGTCALLVDAEEPGAKSLGGAVVRMVDGRPVLWVPAAEFGSKADCWVRGTTLAWLDAVSDAPSADLCTGGNTSLAEEVIVALREWSTSPHVSFRRSFESAEL
jgi:DNA-binding HxlR family transcriptional regulator